MGVIHLNMYNFEKEVIDSDIPVVIDFWAPWCGPCQFMAPVFEELSGEYEGKLKFCKMNTDQEQMLASQFNIQGIPTLSIIYKGSEIGRIVGYAPKETIKQKIDEVLTKIEN